MLLIRMTLLMGLLFISTTGFSDETLAVYYGKNSSGDARWEAKVQILRSEVTGEIIELLEVFYYGNPKSRKPLCYSTNVGNWPANIKAVFVVENRSFDYKMTVDCSNQPKARVRFSSLSPIWDDIFPKNERGQRWYALSMAAYFHNLGWDSNFGQNYSIILKRVK